MECPRVLITGYGEFSRRLHERAAARRLPLTGSIEVSYRCNLHCAHCYINLPVLDREAQGRELTSGEWRAILDQIVDEGCLWLLITGGEPFIRPDFLDIYTHAKQKGLLLTVFTNGTTMTPRIADHLAEWPPFAVEITLYGRTQQVYERVTGVPGSHARCLRGIELLLERRLPLKLKSMVLTLNRQELADMESFARELGLDYRFDPVLNLRLNGDPKPAAFRLSPEEVVALDLADDRRAKEWRQFCGRFWGPPLRRELLYQCGAGQGMFHVDACGQLSACIMARSPSFDLREGRFYEGWHEFMPQVRNQEWSRQTPCQSCELVALCGQCPGWAQMETGDQEAPVDYLCRIAHLRGEVFGPNDKSKGGT